MGKSNLVYLDHILQSIERIIEYTEAMDEGGFLDDPKTQDAVIRMFEINGEASKRISPDFKEQNRDIPWKDMAGMRDKLIHDYIDVDLWIVWKTIKQDLPFLRTEFKKLL